MLLLVFFKTCNLCPYLKPCSEAVNDARVRVLMVVGVVDGASEFGSRRCLFLPQSFGLDDFLVQIKLGWTVLSSYVLGVLEWVSCVYFRF